jgi:hypothetical protein
VRLYVAGATREVRRTLLLAGAGRPFVRYSASLDEAVRDAHGRRA